ncbi:MAG: anti-sigma F factor [Lachnospiraceae bacterium]|nr:anti-sigma F factor [Lachnospiraceae bacterium]
MKNEMTLAFDSISENEGFARVAVAAFVTQLNPTLEEVADIKTAVSEAVTNAIVHGYPDGVHTVVIRARLNEQEAELWIIDEGVGISDIKQAMEPLYTTRPEQERSGMGFMFMEAFMDLVEVQSSPGVGTTVYMKKQIRQGVGRQEG